MTTPPTRDAEATRRRLLQAATAEFARYGIAGARVDRIAAAARANKAQIYHYFGSKEQLFEAVFGDVVADVLDAVPMDAGDLPGYAAALCRGYEERPEIGRLATWYRLEASSQAPLIDAVVEANGAKIAAIEDAQAAGTVTTSYPAVAVLGIVIHLAALWASQTPEFGVATADLDSDARTEIVRQAAAAITKGVRLNTAR